MDKALIYFVDNSISNLNTTLQDKLDNKLSILKNDLKKEFSESLSILKSVILERLLIDNKKLRKRLSWVEAEIENLYEHIYDLEIAVQGVNQQSRRNNAEILGTLLSVNDDILEETTISMLNKIVDDPISPNEVEACHRIVVELVKRLQLSDLSIEKEAKKSRAIESSWKK